MPGIVMGLIVMALVPITFLICPGSQYSCQIIQSVSVLFGMMALALSGAIAVGEWRSWRKAKKTNRAD
ncbi:MAG: hypothetical protein OXE87_03250 [Chloroflexi bacterium]|nr:hypothetical protein [Chloroflexota bacterium]